MHDVQFGKEIVWTLVIKIIDQFVIRFQCDSFMLNEHSVSQIRPNDMYSDYLTIKWHVASLICFSNGQREKKCRRSIAKCNWNGICNANRLRRPFLPFSDFIQCIWTLKPFSVWTKTLRSIHYCDVDDDTVSQANNQNDHMSNGVQDGNQMHEFDSKRKTKKFNKNENSFNAEWRWAVVTAFYDQQSHSCVATIISNAHF